MLYDFVGFACHTNTQQDNFSFSLVEILLLWTLFLYQKHSNISNLPELPSYNETKLWWVIIGGQGDREELNWHKG